MNSRYWRLTEGVISYGLELHRRIDRGGKVDLLREQVVLKDLLSELDHTERAGAAEFAGSADTRAATPAPSTRFLGVRYALVCWLDELFTTSSTCAKEWNENKLELELYGSNDRAWRFWEQAKFAQTSPTTDALEVFYLCAALGFRGALAEQPEKLEAWLAAARQRLGQVSEPDWTLKGELPVALTAPPLLAAGQLRQMALTAWLALLVLAPLTAFYVIHQLGQ